VDWNLDEEQREFLDFVAHMIGLRRRHAVFSRRRFCGRMPSMSKTEGNCLAHA